MKIEHHYCIRNVTASGRGSAHVKRQDATHNMKAYLALLLALCFGLESQARIMTAWSYDGLNAKATFVVIATPTKVKTTTEHAALPNIRTGTNEIIGMGIETSFEVLTVLKGDHSVRTFVLHHYALADSKEMMMGGPGLVAFEPKDRKIYLVFLQQEADGRYVAVSGQIDPFWSFMEFTARMSNVLHPDFGSTNGIQF
jgi:hypothetical protein